MKTLNLTILVFFLGFFTINAQDVITIQPGPGFNDGTDQGTADAGKDTWTNRFSPGANHGDGYSAPSSPRSTCNESDYKSYFQFDVDALPDVVDSVVVGFTHFPHDTYCYSNCEADFYFYYLTEEWNEMTINQLNEPAEDPTPFLGPVFISFPNDFGTVEYDITDAYNYWKMDGVDNFGFVTYSPTSGCNNAAVTFNVHTSDDGMAETRPYLKVYYDATLSVGDLIREDEVLAYPNPFEDRIVVNQADYDRVYLTDLYGKTIAIEFDPTMGEFRTTHLSAGVYILHLEKGNVRNSVKLVKQ